MGTVTRESKCHLKFQFFKMLEVKKGKKRRGEKEAALLPLFVIFHQILIQ